jgi:hypothetical protein
MTDRVAAMKGHFRFWSREFAHPILDPRLKIQREHLELYQKAKMMYKYSYNHLNKLCKFTLYLQLRIALDRPDCSTCCIRSQ